MKTLLLILIRELFNPKLKCERKGHVTRLRMLQVMKRHDWPFVAASFSRTEHYCKRCKAVTEPPMDVLIRAFNSVEMTSDRWNEMDSRGYILED